MSNVQAEPALEITNAVPAVPGLPEKLALVEEVGRYMEASGSPRIAGRILGWLLVCNPPHQSFAELVDALDASKGSISNMTRLLLESGLIERFTLPGDRQTYFRIRPGAWSRLLRRQIEVVNHLCKTAENGIALMQRLEPEQEPWRLQEMHDFYRYVSKTIPEMLSGYEADQRSSLT